MHVGCHISIKNGIDKAPKRAADLGCEVMQIFTRSPQGGKTPELTPEIISQFNLETKIYNLKAVYIHTPYYINLASSNNRIRYGSAKAIHEELERGTLLGAKYVLTHLGSAKDLGGKNALKKAAEMLSKSLENYNGSCKLLLENSAGAGEIIGDTFLELSQIIKLTDNKNIAGICLDTQHSFASGYDWRDFEKNLKKIDEEIGLENIKLIHCNDSQSDCASRVDRHENIGKGKIGKESFEKIVQFAKDKNIDLICETKHPEVKEDIKLLKYFRDK